MGHEETRAFRNEQERNKEERGGQEFHPEHPAPGFKTEQPFIHRRSAGGLGNEVVRHEGQEETADDRDLLDRGETTAILRRRNLGDIGGRHDAGRADGETANDAIDNEFRRRTGNARAPGGNDEAGGGNNHHGAAAECIGQGARQRRADRATQQHGRDVEARPDILRIEGNPQAVNGSVDHARVESKKKSADRGDGGDEKDLAETALSCIHTYSR